MPLPVSQPADARGQPLEGHLVLRHADPAREARIAREQVQDRLVRAPDVRGVPAQRGPAEGPPALAELWTDERGHEARDVEGVRHPLPLRLSTEVVAVVEGDRSRSL